MLKHKTLLFYILMHVCFPAVSQEWTWMNGSNVALMTGFYGTQGVASTTNTPGGRFGTIREKDAAGNFWLFGGQGMSSMPGWGISYLNDLWKYNPSTNEWMWVKGSNLFGSPVYGVQGVSNASNCPGGRFNSSSWMDTNGNIWIFGGQGFDASVTFGTLNDLWKYNPGTNEWTWMKGGNSIFSCASHTLVGVPSATASPSVRYSAITWVDTTGNLCLYGGYGSDLNCASGGGLNDMWKYNISTNQWTLISGTPTLNAAPVYNTLGSYHATNNPGARLSYSYWKDASNKIWVGNGDMWCYHPGLEQWACMRPPINATQTPVYGNKGVTASTNNPSNRSMPATWTDNFNNLWFFGGMFNPGFVRTNDLWKYSISSNEWTWVGGDTITDYYGTYGTQGVSSPLNKPGGRNYAGGWTDNNGVFWMFGEAGFVNFNSTYSNDLWRYENCIYNSTPVSGLQICAGTTTTLNTTVNSGTVHWYASATSTTSIGSGTSFITPALTAGTYTYYAKPSQCSNSSLRAQIVVTAFAMPVLSIAGPSLICQGASVVLTVTGASSYTWSTGASTSTISATASGPLSYSVTGSNGCTATATLTLSTLPAPSILVNSSYTTVCAGNAVILAASGSAGSYTWSGGITNGFPFTPVVSDQYTVVGTDTVTGCQAQVTCSVIVDSIPQIHILGSDSICAGTASSLLASGASSYTWNTGAQASSISVSPLSGTIYSVTGSGLNGCVNSGTFLVHVFTYPTVGITGPTLVCEGYPVVLSGTGADFYTWSNGSNSSSLALNPVSSVSFSLTGSNANLCPATNTAVVTVNIIPSLVAALVTGRDTICLGESAILSASGAISYTWSTGSSLSSVSVAPLSSSVYTLEGLQENGCLGTSTVLLIVDLCTSEGEINKGFYGLKIYPNPTNGKELTVVSTLEQTVLVLNGLGNEVKRFTLSAENNYTFNLNGMSAGIYFLKSSSSKEMSGKKIVISH